MIRKLLGDTSFPLNPYKAMNRFLKICKNISALLLKRQRCHLAATYTTRFSGWIVASAICFLLTACVLAPPQSEFDAKTQWLESNFPSRAKNIEQINADPRFKQDILDGVASKDMSLAEVLVAREVSPYGPHPAEKVFWCSNNVVKACSAECSDCRAMLVLKHHIHLFETGARGLQLVASYNNDKWPPHLAYLPSSYSAAKHILRNEYARGMRLDDIAQVSTPPASKIQYYCGGANRGRIDIPCATNCPTCRVEIHIPRDRDKPPRVIELHFSNGIVDNLSQRFVE